jgi:hypothetical protein
MEGVYWPEGGVPAELALDLSHDPIEDSEPLLERAPRAAHNDHDTEDERRDGEIGAQLVPTAERDAA